MEKGAHGSILTVEELVEIGAAAIRLGVRKIRLTGGEPLVRRGILDICRGLRAIPELKELCLTTNGSLLPELAQPLREARGRPPEYQSGHAEAGTVSGDHPAGNAG